MELLLLTTTERVALLAALAAVLYVSPLLHATGDGKWEFIALYDDQTNFLDNPVLQQDDAESLFAWRNLYAMATMRRINVYEPLGWLLKALVVRLCGGLDAWAVRVVTAALHFGSACVLLRASVLLLEVNALASEGITERACQREERQAHHRQREQHHPEHRQQHQRHYLQHAQQQQVGQKQQTHQPERTPADAHSVAQVGTAAASDDHRRATTAAAASPRATATTTTNSNDSNDSNDNPSANYCAARQHQTHLLGCCLSALLYAVHPMHVEVVAWPSAQPYALAALFANLSLLFYLQKLMLALRSAGDDKQLPASERAQQIGDAIVSTTRLDWYVTGFYLCSVLTKSAAVLLPVAFFLVDALVVARSDAVRSGFSALRCARQKAPMLAILLTFVMVTIWSNGESWEDILTLSLSERVLKAAMAPAWILRHLIWPTRLRVHYQLRDGDLDLFGSMEPLLSVTALVLCVLVGVWRWRQRRSPVLLFATVYFCAMLLPTSGLVQHGIVSQGCDRYAYLSSAVFVPLGGYVFGGRLLLGSSDLHTLRRVHQVPKRVHIKRFEHHEHLVDNEAKDTKFVERSRHSTKPMLVKLTYGAVLCTSILLSTSLMKTWRNERVLYEHNLRLDPTDWRMYSWLAPALASSTPSGCVEDPHRCAQLWRLARVFAPAKSLNGKLFRAKALVPLGEFDLACETYEELVLVHPDSPPLLNNIGVCRLLRGGVTLNEARSLFARAATAPAYERVEYWQNSISQTLKKFESWAAPIPIEHGDREPTPEERLTFNDWVMV